MGLYRNMCCMGLDCSTWLRLLQAASLEPEQVASWGSRKAPDERLL
jgi:hypothetical protein